MTQTNYTQEIADTICSRMSEGESLRAICRDVGMPSEGAVRGWAVRNVDGFGDRYRAARRCGSRSAPLCSVACHPDLLYAGAALRLHAGGTKAARRSPSRPETGRRVDPVHSGGPTSPPTNDCSRRISPIAVRLGEGPMSDHAADAQPARRELVFMPQTGPWAPRVHCDAANTFRARAISIPAVDYTIFRNAPVTG
jgi:hypothetical protein